MLTTTMHVDTEVDCRTFEADPSAWFARFIERNRACAFRFLLALSRDGVTWGRVADDGTLVTSDGACEWSPRLGPTLERARLFSDDLGEAGTAPAGAEIHLWRGSVSWRAAFVRERHEKATDWSALDGAHVLLGTRVERISGSFTLLVDGEGHRHAVPGLVPQATFAGEERPMRLLYRQYFQPDKTNGALRAQLIRLGGVRAAGARLVG
jgi:CRISPR-associated protein (TIGR03984 family)